MSSRDVTGGSAALLDLVGNVFAAGWRICSVLVHRDRVTYEFCRESGRCETTGPSVRKATGPTAAAAVRSFLAELGHDLGPLA